MESQSVCPISAFISTVCSSKYFDMMSLGTRTSPTGFANNPVQLMNTAAAARIVAETLKILELRHPSGRSRQNLKSRPLNPSIVVRRWFRLSMSFPCSS